MLHITPELKKNIRKWSKALRNGKFQEIEDRNRNGWLEHPVGYFSPFGVACKLFIPEDKQMLDDPGQPDKDDLDDMENWLAYRNSRYGALDGLGEWLEYRQKNAPDWLKQIGDDFSVRTDNRSAHYEDPMKRNLENIWDDHGLSFDEFADILEITYLYDGLPIYCYYCNQKIEREYQG